MVGLDVRPFGNGEAEIAEDRRDLVDDLADRVDAAALGGSCADRQADIDALGGQPGSDCGAAQGRAPRA